MTAPVRERPAVLPTKAAKAPASEERVLASGLRVVAVRQPTVPLVEVRLRVPWASGSGAVDKIDTHVARGMVLAETLLTGTATRSAVQIAEDLQAVGGSLGAGVDSDRLVVSGSVLAKSLPKLLELLADVLQHASYPADEVEGERERLAQDLTVARSVPGVLAGAALGRRLHGDHPYARELARADVVAGVKPGALRTLHAKRVSPAGAILLLVGDLRPTAALDAVEKALGDWEGAGAPPKAPALPALSAGPLTLVNRPGAVQSNIRFAGRGLRRADEGYSALFLANTIFGGYFSSRLVANLREKNGFTYSPRSGIDHTGLGSFVSVTADVATGVTAPALVETRYELARIATSPVTQAELDAARSYGVGTLALGMATQAGLASTLITLLGQGLSLDWLRGQPGRLAEVSVADVQQVAAEFYAPGSLVELVLGDEDAVLPRIQGLGPVETATTDGL